MVQKSNLHLKHWGINTVLLSPLLPHTNIHPSMNWGEIKRENHIWKKINNRGGNVKLSCSENISCYSTNEHQNRGRIEIENYISLFPLDLLLRFSSFNSPGYVGSQTATVNKQDYPVGHASKSYHIGAGRGVVKLDHSNRTDRGQDTGRHGCWTLFLFQTNLPIFLCNLW